MRYDLTFNSVKGESQHFEFVSDYENEARATVSAILYDWPAASNISLRAAGDQFKEPYDVSYPRENSD